MTINPFPGCLVTRFPSCTVGRTVGGAIWRGVLAPLTFGESVRPQPIAPALDPIEAMGRDALKVCQDFRRAFEEMKRERDDL